MEQPSWASGADDSGAPSPALPSLGDLPAAGSRPQRVHYSLYTDFAPAYRSQPRKPPRRERAQLPTPAWRAPHAGWDASVSQDGTFDATLLSDPRASQASVRRASATTASAAMSEDLFDASARTYAAEAKGRQRRHHRRDACKRGEAVLRRAQLRLDEGRLNEAASALEEARQYFKRGRGLSRLQQVTSMQERLRGDAMVVRAEAALVAHAYDEHVAALTKAAWHFGYFFDGRLEEASNAVELAEDQRRKAAVADILSRTRDVAFAQAKECITASLDALDRFDTLAANAQLEAARRSYDWLEYDASEALDAVRVRIARVSDQSTAAIEIERVVRGSQGRTRTVLLRLRQLMEELRDMDHCQDSPAADVEAMELNIERSMNGLVQPLISEKAQHSKEYLNRVLNVLDDEEAIIDVLGMIEHKSHSAVFCSCCLMFLDVMFSIEQEKAFNMHNELLSRHHAFVVRSVVHCMLQHPGVPDIRTAVVQLLAFIFTFYPAIDADTATGDLLAQKETVSIIIAMYDEDHKSAAGVHEVALVATAALLRLICTTEERVLLIAAEDGFRKLVRAMKHHIEESEMPGGGGRASGGGAPRLNSIGEGSIGSEPAAEARQATRAAALVVKPPGQFQSRRTSVTHMLQRRISETESRTYRTTMGVQSPQALVERKTRALQKSISHSKLTSGATAAIAHNTRGMQLLNTVARCCRAPLHDFVAAHDVCQVAELAVLNAPGATQLHAQAARLLLYLTSSEHEAAYLLQTKGVETMVLMHSHNRGFDANENVLVHCCRALTCLLAENEVSAEAFKQIDATGGVSEVCDALRSKEARNFAQYAVAALDVLAKAAPWLNAAGEGEEPGTRDRRRQEALDACQAVLTAMARFATVHDVQLRATEAMLALCSTSEECADVLLQGGALGGLIAALRRFEGRHELMELTIASASVLGRRDGAIEQLNALGCGTLLSFILCKFVSSAPIVRSSLALLLTILQQWGDLVELVLRIDNAKELATGMTGDISDPHCVVFWNGRRVGQTSVIQNDPNPIWDDEQFTVMIPPTVSDCTLRVEVRLGDPYDNDLGGELRGQVFFDGKQLEAWLNCAQLEAQKQSDGVIAWDTQCEVQLQANRATTERHAPRGRIGVAVRFEFGTEPDDDEKGSSQPLPLIWNCIKIVSTHAVGVAPPSAERQRRSSITDVTRCLYSSVYWNDLHLGNSQLPSMSRGGAGVTQGPTQFTLRDPLHLAHSTLRVEVRDQDPKGPGDFLGEITFQAEELIEHHLCVETKQFALQRKMDSGEIQLVQGSLGVRVNCLQPSAIIFAMTQNLADASIQVGACKALTELADTPDQVVDIIEAGGVNALVRALETHKLCLDRQDGAESGRTDVFYSAASLAAAKEAAEMPTKASAEVLEEALSTMRHLLKIGPKDTMELVLEFSTGEHAAAATGFVCALLESGLPASQLMDQHDPATVLVSSITRNPDNMAVQSQGLRALAYISQDAESARELLSDMATATLQTVNIEVVSACDLASADRGRRPDGEAAKSDPQAIVFWNDKNIGRTAVISDTLDPVWSGEYFNVALPVSLTDSTMRVVVRDEDPNAEGDFIGEIKMSPLRMKKLLSSERHELPLQGSMDTNEKQVIKKGSSLGIRCKFGSSSLHFEVLDAKELPQADVAGKVTKMHHEAKADAFATVFWNGAPLLKTPVVPNNNSPKWKNQSRHILLPPPSSSSRLRIEVRDFDCEGVLGDLLGEVVLTGEELMRIAEEEADRTASSGQMLPVTEKPFELQRKELSNERQLVQGSINLKIQLVELSSCVVSVYRRQASVLRSFADADQGAAYVQQRMTGAKKLLDEGVLCLARLATVREAVVPIERAEGVVAVLDAIRTVPRLLSVEHTASAMQFLKRVADQSMMRVAEITFISAAGLARADAGKGDKSDPFVTVFWQQTPTMLERRVGETPYLEDTHHPCWTDCSFSIPLPPDRVLLGSTLRCEVRDFDYDHSAFLGHITVSGRELCNLVYAASSDREEYTHPLTRNRQASEKQFVSGDMTFKVGVRDGPGSEYVVSCETIACVLESLDVHSSDGDILRHGLALLRCIVDSDEKLQRVLTSGDVFAVLRHAQQACTHEAAARGIAFLLVELLKRPECREHIDESVLAETFRRFSDNPGWIEHARDVLALIANVKSTPGFFSFSLQFLGVPATVRCARCHEDDESLQQAVALALLRLTSSDDDAQALVRERALDVLLAAMRRFPQNAEIIEHARQLWKEVDRYCGRNKELAIDVGNLECVDDFKQAAGL